MNELLFAVGYDRWLSAKQNVENYATAPNIRSRRCLVRNSLRRRENCPSNTLINYLLNPKYFRNAEVIHLYNVLLFGIKENAS